MILLRSSEIRVYEYSSRRWLLIVRFQGRHQYQHSGESTWRGSRPWCSDRWTRPRRHLSRRLCAEREQICIVVFNEVIKKDFRERSVKDCRGRRDSCWADTTRYDLIALGVSHKRSAPCACWPYIDGEAWPWVVQRSSAQLRQVLSCVTTTWQQRSITISI